MARDEHPTRRVGRIVVGLAIATGMAAAAGVLAAGTITLLFARTVITPPTRRDDDLRILGHSENTITLSATIDSMTPGRYSLWFRLGTGHARIGEILSVTESTVTRRLLAVDSGDLAGARRGRLSGWFYLGPEEFGFPFSDVAIETELGAAPAWLVPAANESGRWMIGVHGRAVRRQEALRAVPAFHGSGYTSLLISYRNDGDAPRSADNRYALGDTEWRDVEAAMRFAIERGARQIVLMGWSMGGATVLQAVTRSPLAEVVHGVILESPVVDWVAALQFQATLHGLPRLLRSAVLRLLSERWAGALTGQAAPIDLARLDFVSRSAELRTPILLLHSADDAYIPVTASRRLAAARPDIVTFEEFSVAGHTRLWNYDPERWDAAIIRWLKALR